MIVNIWSEVRERKFYFKWQKLHENFAASLMYSIGWMK